MGDDNVEVLSLALKKLNLLHRLTFLKKPYKSGKKNDTTWNSKENMALLACKQHGIYIDIKTSKIKSSQ